MVQKKLPLINSAHGSETRNIINELIKLFNGMGYTYNESLQKAQDILDEAQQTNDMNESVQQQINTLIAESGTSDAEVLQARIDAEGNEYPVLKDRLDESDEQLEQKTNYLKSENLLIKSRNNNTQIRPLFTIISDDGHANDMEMLDLFKSKGVRAGEAMISGYINNTGYMTSEQLKTLHNEGWEIMLHDTLHRDMTTLTESELDSAMSSGKQAIEDLGIPCNGLVVPYGKINSLVSQTAENYFDYCFGENIGYRNSEGIQTFNLQRVAHGNEQTWAHYKNAVDFGIENNQWVVFVTHWYQLNEEQKQLMSDLIDYILGLGYDIVTPSEALEVFGNAIEYRNYESGDFFCVTNAGNTLFNTQDNASNVVVDELNGKSVNDPITAYEGGKITYTTISGTNATGFPSSGGGTLKTVRTFTGSNGFQYQEYSVAYTATVYRRAVKSDGTWSIFYRVLVTSESTKIVPDRAVQANSTSEQTVSLWGADHTKIINAIPKTNPPSGITFNILIHPNLNNIIIRYSNVTDTAITVPETEWVFQVI